MTKQDAFGLYKAAVEDMPSRVGRFRPDGTRTCVNN
jgi:hypothetical protein